MAELKSVEQTLIKISLKTLYFIGGSLVMATFFAVMLYNDIMKGQEAILTEVKKNAIEREYEIQVLEKEDELIRKDIKAIDSRIAQMEK